MSEYLVAALLGVIEGITEFLPISSTGHLLIAEHWLGAKSDLFNIAIQAGAILAVCLIYRTRLWQLVTCLHQPEQRDYAAKLGVAFAITAVLGLILAKAGFKLPTEVTPVAWALVIGGVWMVLAEWRVADRAPVTAIGWHTAVLVGVMQVVAGLSGYLAFGRDNLRRPPRPERRAAQPTEFAFLVGIPTMFAATGYELLKSGRHGAPHEDWSLLAVAFAVSTVTAFVAVKWLLRYIRTHRFFAFAVYRIALGVALLLGLPAGACRHPLRHARCRASCTAVPAAIVQIESAAAAPAPLNACPRLCPCRCRCWHASCSALPA
ncbi:undecaprenyl-diphosphate phosphatase [Paucibacter sp. O1-1]|nr:undecaprenyl-diphosphate phosphatase [Paucibacter sp. O1-1]MDA3831417.1 undecaprenyl-diphosphate phosphatase [Paucibacter sp. O1-1]